MPRKVVAPKPPKRPSWSVWRHKKEGWITCYVEGHLKPEYRWDPATRTQVAVPPKYVQDDFEALNPAEFTFKATLQFYYLYTGRSAVNFEFRDLQTSRGYTMLAKEFERVFKECYFHKGAIRGLWRFEKHGSSVGIYLVKELDDDEDDEDTQNDNSSNPG